MSQSRKASVIPTDVSLEVALVGSSQASRRRFQSLRGWRRRCPVSGMKQVLFEANAERGGYCSMVMISLLNLPLSLPPEAPARRAGLESFIDGLPEYMSRCRWPVNATNARLTKPRPDVRRRHLRVPTDGSPRSLRFLRASVLEHSGTSAKNDIQVWPISHQDSDPCLPNGK